jgi:hypothetical protein
LCWATRSEVPRCWREHRQPEHVGQRSKPERRAGNGGPACGRESLEPEGGERPMARIGDLREFVAVLESLGDVEHIDRPVSAVLEAAAITRRSTEQRRPAPLFDNITETGPGFPMFGAPGALSSDPRYPMARVALSLGLSHDATARELVEHLAAVHAKAPIPPKVISADSAPCKQNVLLGAEATLDRFRFRWCTRTTAVATPTPGVSSSREPPTDGGRTGRSRES